MTRRILSILLFFAFNGSVSRAQDPHFSQYFSSPLTLNPANTGNFHGPARIGMNLRNQWMGIGEPFQTGTVSFDGQIFKEKMNNGQRLAVGVFGLFDRSAGGLLNSNYLSASVAYHLWFDQEETKKLSVGFQGTLAHRKLDATRISFAEQFTNFGFDLNLPSNERFGSSSQQYADLNAGIMYSAEEEHGSFYVGLSAYHVNGPMRNFSGLPEEKVSARFTAHAGKTIYLSDLNTLILSGMYVQQARSESFLGGLAYGHDFGNESSELSLFAGLWYRSKDAIIPYIGYVYNNFQLGLTYDATISELNLSGTRNKSFELSMTYWFPDRSAYKRFVPWY